ncbi:Uncharacterized protein TCM_018104 [Theobroma cacao]|uniref:Uncharacterized protein n=1 Tax=Theobroma cacao TaxID=3641 RepID=A0A061EF86_THECC|nr:Uncharacterized protein TCM_018104 [Theobroma cacao]
MYAWLSQQMIMRLRPLDSPMLANIVETAIACRIRWSEASGGYYVVSGPRILFDFLLETKISFDFQTLIPCIVKMKLCDFLQLPLVLLLYEFYPCVRCDLRTVYKPGYYLVSQELTQLY